MPRPKPKLSSVQADAPQLASLFESEEKAREATALLGPTRRWRTEPCLVKGETFTVVRHWPETEGPIGAGRKWLRIANPKPRKKPHGEEA